MMAGRLITRTRLLILAGLVVGVISAAVFATSWYYSSEIESGGLRVDHARKSLDLEVVSMGEGTVALKPISGSPRLDEPGTLGLEGQNGYGRVGGLISVGPDWVVREFALLEGDIEAGDAVRLDRSSYPGEPRLVTDAAHREVAIRAPIGTLRALHVDGSDDTWAILVHGRTADWRETYRALNVINNAGLPSLVISYRNDADSPGDPSGYYRFGVTEWEDLEAAARYALANGAKDLLIVGFSMGGGITTSFLYNSNLASEVAGVVLDAPMLDFGQTVDLAAKQRNVPQFIAGIAKRLATLRFGVDWQAMNYLDRVDELQAPVLVFHGDADATVPFTLSEELARRRPDLTTFVPFEDAVHVGSWNMDSILYERELLTFLERVAQ